MIRARLAGAREPVQGLVVPPLGRDDPDTSLLLLYLYDQRGKIRSFFDGALSILNGRKDQRLDQATFHLFTLLYRGLLKLDPEYAGLRHPTLCRLAHENRGRDAEGIWLALGWEYGVLLGANRNGAGVLPRD